MINSLILEITNICNFKCKMCIKYTDYYKKWAHAVPNKMSFDMFKRAIDEFCLINPHGHVIPQFQGESLTHPDFLDFCAYINDKELTFGFTTNASLLTPNITDALLKMRNFRSIAFSIDSLNKTTFESQRGNNMFDRCISNIQYFIQQAKTAESHPIVGFNAVITSENNHELDTYPSDIMNKFNIHENWDKFTFTACHCTDDNIIPLNTNFSLERQPCTSIFRNLYILTNGKIIACCCDSKYQIELGNFNDSNLIDIWNSNEYEMLRKIQTGRKWDEHPVCKNCYTWTSGLSPIVDEAIISNVKFKRQTFCINTIWTALKS